MRVVVIQLAYLGDVILTLPLLRLARQVDGVDWVGAVVRPIGAEFLRGQGVVDEIVVYDKRGADTGTRGTLRMASALRRLRIDAALVVHRSFRTALIVLLSGIPRRIGFDESGGSFLLTRTVPYRARPHEAERAASLVEPLGVSTGPGRVPFEVVVPEGGDASLDLALDAAGLRGDDPIVAVAPGSQWPTKRWGADRFAAAADLIAGDLGAAIAIVGAESDRAESALVADRLGGKAVDLTGRLPLDAWIALIARARVLLANDSAPGHVAAGVGTPVVAVFGPTVPEQGFPPYGDRARVLEAGIDCRPCGSHGGERCPLGTLDCMERIGVPDVVSAAREIMEGTD